MDETIKTAINTAKKLTKRHGLAPGFDIKDFITSLGINLEITPLESMSGFAYQKEGKKVIGINETDGEQRQRFTMAHELGHMFVHVNDGVIFDRGFAYFRDGNSSTGLNPKERQANAFAAELLMPAEHLIEQVRSLEGGIIDPMQDDSKIRKLAKLYGVSFSAMSVRLDSLNQAWT
jgi:Zn-dependent peptidase ImmA (M78 family)